MATRFTASEVIQLLDDDDFDIPGEEESDFEGDEVAIATFQGQNLKFQANKTSRKI